MPRYDYTCTKCNVIEEVSKSYKEFDREEIHSCGSKMEKNLNLTPFFDGALTPSRGGASLQAIKKDDKELSSFYSAVKQGIEPISTKQKDIDAAVRLSDQMGVAFDGNKI